MTPVQQGADPGAPYGMGARCPLVTFVMVVQDQAPALARCLDAMAKTLPSHLEFEVLVIDNGSTDATSAVLAMVSGDIRVVRHMPSVPPGPALDEALREATSPYVCLLDVDHPPSGQWAEPLVRTLDEVQVLAAVLPAAGDGPATDRVMARADKLRSVGGFGACRALCVEEVVTLLKSADLLVATVDIAPMPRGDAEAERTSRVGGGSHALSPAATTAGIHVCTIIAHNYLPQARVLAETFRRVHPDGKMTVLIIEDAPNEPESEEPFEVLRVTDLVGDKADLRRMAAIYDVLEYSTALKPWLLQTLLGRGASSVIYLDPDIEVFGRLDELARLAETHEAVLTPHVTAPMPRDDKMISESMILSSGIYNLGFVAVGAQSMPFLQFWMERLRRDCMVDPQNMRFVDQRWLDFAPGIYDVAIVRDPSYNVAYWNLDHRNVEWSGSAYEVTGRPLRFFHFSGYSPTARHVLSKHQIDPPRILLSEHPIIKKLCDDYGDLLEAHGHGSPERTADYQFSRMANGIAMDRYVRRLYRDSVMLADEGGYDYPPDPFGTEGAEIYSTWIKSPAADKSGPSRLNWYLTAVYAERFELRLLFPDPQRRDYDKFVAWAHREAAAGRLEGRLLPPLTDQSGPHEEAISRYEWAPPDALRPGFTVAGYLKAELGIGEWGRLTAQAIDTAGLPSAKVVTTSTTSRQQHPYEVRTTERYDYDINLICANADQFPSVVAELGRDSFVGRYTIGQWAWELEEFPDRWRTSFELVDEIWAISEFTRAAIAAVTDKPVFTCPPAIVQPSVPEEVDRAELGLPRDRYVFLFTFDLLSILHRKNPLGLVEAFCRAFPTETPNGPVLVLKVINGDQRRSDLEQVRLAVGGRSDIVLLDRYFAAPMQAALMAAADCYISLHRSEGFGLTMGEAMALGKPVIATGYSGNLDFMDHDTAYLVNWADGSVPPGCDPYPVGARWAEPDLDDAARFMRYVVEHPAEAAQVGARARQAVLAQHGLGARAELIRQRFDAIQRSRAGGGGAAAARARSVTGVDGIAPLPPDAVPSYPPGHDPRAASHNSSLDPAAARRQPAEALNLEARVDEMEHLLSATRLDAQRNTATHQAALAQLRQGVLDLEHFLQVAVADIAKGSTGLQDQISDLRRSVEELYVVPYMADPAALLTEDESGRPAIGYRHGDQEAERGTKYASFEDLFRGSEELIRERQRAYLPLLNDHAPVIDVGCGRGEMLDLLREARIEAVGIDIDRSMIQRCVERGHPVHEMDALEYLAKLPDTSVGTVFSAQVIEHLSHGSLVAFLAEAYRVLQPHGLLIAETVNPHAVHAFKTFWTDITHQAPIFPEVAVALVRSAGFDEALVHFPNGTGELESDRWREGEYAVVAHKGLRRS